MKYSFVAWTRAPKRDLMRLGTPFLRVGTVLLFAMCFLAVPAPSEAADSAAVLDTSSFWRVHYTIRPPVVREGQQLRKLPTLAGDSPAPPANWTTPDFDDSDWTRITGRPFPETVGVDDAANYSARGTVDAGIAANEGSSPALALICLRGKFGVTDPAAVRNLKLSLVYRGGVVVYVNGREIGRAGMAKGASGPEAVADDYPKEAFVGPDGSPLLNPRSRERGPSEGLKARVRRAEIPIPASALRKGTNVLAIEVHRSAYLSAVKEWIETKKLMEHEIYSFLWATCGLHSTSLQSASPAGLTPNIERPKGFQVWNSQSMQQDFDLDYGDAFEPLRPVKIIGSRGGVFSGKVVVGSDRPIKGLKARITDLTSDKGGGKIAASAVKVRYALPTGSEPVTEAHYPVPAALLDGLSDTAPPVVEVRTKPGGQWSFGAVCPVWVTVAVPADARPGDYTGKLTITAEGASKAVEVPVELNVSRWLVPKPSEFRTIVDLIESPESVAMHYEVPIYSDKHFRLLEKSLEQMGHVGNWTVHIPLICNTNLGNEQTMVRWIRKGDGTYKFDFSPMDKYLDIAEKHMGKPRIVFVIVWDFFLGIAGRASVHPQIQAVLPPGDEDIPVSILDEATQQVSMGTVGRYDDKGEAAWKALVAEMMEHLKKRGLDKAVLVGMADDVYPSAEIVNFWKELLPGAAWGRYGHFELETWGTPFAPVGYQAHAFAPDWGITPEYGWKRPDRTALYFRTGAFYLDLPWHTIPWDIARLVGELNIQGPRRGFGRIGLDFWPVLKNARGQAVKSIQGRYPKSFWRQLDMMVHCLLPPGPDGAMATGKLEMMREGLQETEARIFLESVLTDPAQRKRLSDSLAGKAQQVLDERVRALAIGLENQPLAGFATNPKPWLDGYGAGDYRAGQAAIFRQWYMESGWQGRSEKLFAVAAEVAAALTRS